MGASRTGGVAGGEARPPLAGVRIDAALAAAVA
jgi:hypothetical protein